MNKIGKFGEDIACKFLQKHDYSIVERNYSKKWGELDIVARKGEKIFFIEVKTVSCEMPKYEDKKVTRKTRKEIYKPEENMSLNKIRKFKRIISSYLQEKEITCDWNASFLAIRVDMATRKAKVRFMENLVLR